VSPKTVRDALDNEIVPRYFTGPDDSLDSDWELSSHGDYTPPPARKELDAVVFHHYRTILETAKVLRLKENAFSVNPDVADAFASKEAPVAPLYHRLAQALFEDVPWDMPRYGSPLPYLRESAGFLLYALEKLSRSEGADADGWVNADRLVDVFLGAHPGLTGESEEDAARAAYWGRFHMDAQFGHHLCVPLGLVAVRRTGLTVMIRPTPVFRTVFDVGE
jgi:hypothetical protein